jgi:hypothetical protein
MSLAEPITKEEWREVDQMFTNMKEDMGLSSLQG